MSSLPQVADALQHVLTEVAGPGGPRARLPQRRSKLSGGRFVQTLALGWLGKPRAGTADLAQHRGRPRRPRPPARPRPALRPGGGGAAGRRGGRRRRPRWSAPPRSRRGGWGGSPGW